MTARAAFVFGSCSLLLLMSMFYRTSGAIIAPILSAELGLTSNDLGLLGGAFFYSFAIMQIPLGLLIDRIGPKITLIVLNSVAVFGAVVFACSQSPNGLIAGRCLLGLGVSGNLMGPLKIFSKRFAREKFATTSGALISVASLGGLASCSPLAVLVEGFGWRASFYALGGLHCLFIILMLFIGKDVRGNAGDSGETYLVTFRAGLRSYGTLVLNWSYWAIAGSVFLRYGAFACIQSMWAGPFLVGLLGLNFVAAGNILLLMNVGFILGAPIGGSLSDRILRSRKRAILLAYSISAGAALILSFSRSSSSLIIVGLAFFFVGFFNAFNQISFVHIKELMPEEMAGRAMSGINFFLMLGAGVFTHGLGIILGKFAGSMSIAGYYQRAFLICFVSFAISSVLYLIVREPNGETIKVNLARL